MPSTWNRIHSTNQVSVSYVFNHLSDTDRENGWGIVILFTNGGEESGAINFSLGAQSKAEADANVLLILEALKLNRWVVFNELTLEDFTDIQTNGIIGKLK